MSSVLGTEKDTPISPPCVPMVEKSLRSWSMLLLSQWEATVIEKTSTDEIMRHMGIEMCRGATSRRKWRG